MVYSQTSFASYSLQDIHTDSHTNIQIFDLMQKIHVAANICFRANIRLRFSHTDKDLLQNIRLAANILKILSKFYIKANIQIRANIRYVLLQII